MHFQRMSEIRVRKRFYQNLRRKNSRGEIMAETENDLEVAMSMLILVFFQTNL